MTKFKFKISLSFCLIVPAILFAHATSAAAQDQSTGSLADAARQARTQKQAQGASTSTAQQTADQLSEGQNHPAPSTTSSKDQTTTAPAANTTSSADPNQPANAQQSSAPGATNANGSPAQGTASTNQPATPPQTPVKPGPKAQPFHYCKSQNNCWDASVIVPADAKLVSSDCKQYVFEIKVKGSPYMLMAGPAGDACLNSYKSTANQVHWGELATPESALPPGAFNLIGSEQTTLEGKQALLTEIGFRKGLTEWKGKRIDLESNGVPLVVGCMAPRDHFEEGDDICTAWMNSLRLP